MQQQIVYREFPETKSMPSSYDVTNMCTTMGKWAADNGARIALITPITGSRQTHGQQIAWVQTLGLIFVIEKP